MCSELEFLKNQAVKIKKKLNRKMTEEPMMTGALPEEDSDEDMIETEAVGNW